MDNSKPIDLNYIAKKAKAIISRWPKHKIDAAEIVLSKVGMS